jgi:uncharacterized repeat protein (TIGR02543 family)
MGADGGNDVTNVTLTTTVAGPGKLSFWWKTDWIPHLAEWAGQFDDETSFVAEGEASFAIDGIEAAAIQDITDWTQVECEIEGAGSHTLSWTFWREEMDEEDEVNANCLWLDDVEWRASGATEPPVDPGWPATACAIALNRQGGVGGPASVTAINGRAMPAITPPARPGHAFEGYYSEPNGGGTQYYTATGASARDWNRTAAATLYAKWTKNAEPAPTPETQPPSPPATYTIVFNPGGGQGTMPAQMVNPGASVALSANTFTKGGSVFLGWAKTKTGAVAYKDKASVKNLAAAGKTATLYAVWAKKNYKVTFNGNGGKLPKKKKMKALAMTYGTSKKLSKNLFTRKGYVFIGWSTKKKGPVEFPNKASVKNLTTKGGAVTLYAQWAKENYKVAFDRNGGTGTMAAQAMTYGKAKKLAANKFKAPKGKKFVGWATSKANAKNGIVKYKNRASVKNLVTNGKTVKLYAVWKKK